MPSLRNTATRASWLIRHQAQCLVRERHITGSIADDDDTSSHYSRYIDDEDEPEEHSERNPVLATLFAVALGVGVHASKEALVPSEPALEKIGLDPLAYAALTLMPVALGIFSPIFWGILWDRNVRLVLLGAPFGELVGAVLTATGLHLVAEKHSWLAATCLITGLLTSSACRAGITIAEFATCGRIQGSLGKFLGFSALVLAKHGNGALMSWGVPHILAHEPSDSLLGVTYLQVALVMLHTLAFAAGACLCFMHRPLSPAPAPISCSDATARDDKWDAPAASGSTESSSASATDSPPDVADALLMRAAAKAPTARKSSRSEVLVDAVRSVLVIGLWRALQVGTLHAYHSIRVEFVISLGGLSLIDAGGLFAKNDAIAMVLLPALALLTRYATLRLLALVIPFISLAALTCFALNSWSRGHGVDIADDAVPRVELLILSVLEVASPVIPLALLPARRGGTASNLGSAFGIIETLFIAYQIVIVMLLGAVRRASGQASDFHGPVAVLSCGFAGACAVSAVLYLLSPDPGDCCSSGRVVQASVPLAAYGAWANTPNGQLASWTRALGGKTGTKHGPGPRRQVFVA